MALFALAVYRAATLSFTVDEATTYVTYVVHGWTGIFHGPFDANNHILYSILEKFTRQWFGPSEFSLRLPALAGAALFLWSVARLCAMLIPGLWFSLLGFLLVTANPITLDFMAAARGYGLALGLLAFALLMWIEWLEDERGFRIALASIALGLSVSANLMFAFASIALFSAGCLFLIRRQRFKLIPAAVVPAIVIPLALWWAPFQDYSPDAFYFGTPTIYASTESMELAVFDHDFTRGDPFENWSTLFFLRWWILPYLVPLLWCCIVFWIRRRLTEGLALTTLVFGTACFGMWLAHVWLKVLYPEERTGLSFIFFFLLTWTAAIGVWWQTNRVTRWTLAFPSLLLALVFLAQFAGQFDPRYFGAWRVNWKMHQIMSDLRAREGPGEHKLRTHWIYQSTAEYYRLRWKMAFDPIVREPDKFDLVNADYFLIPIPTREQAAATGLHILYRDEVTGTTLLEK
ncbi:MAG TPA: hypothetical protein VGL53_26850 [Bryobacteraceae bacterium]